MGAKIEKRKAFTTGQAAKILGVSDRTLVKMCASGKLESYRLPGSMARRVEPESLEKLMRDHGIRRALPDPGRTPAPAPAATRHPKVLFVGFAPEARGPLLVDGVVPMFSRSGSRGAGCVVLGGDPPGPDEPIEWAADADGLGRAIAELAGGGD